MVKKLAGDRAGKPERASKGGGVGRSGCGPLDKLRQPWLQRRWTVEVAKQLFKAVVVGSRVEAAQTLVILLGPKLDYHPHEFLDSEVSSAMDFAAFQREIDAFISQFEEGYWPPLANLARLSEEVGELAREVNHHFGPKRKREDESTGSIAAELGDILFTVGAIANSLDIDLDEVAESTLAKVTKRDANRWTPKQG